jgi:hypothetical protein
VGGADLARLIDPLGIGIGMARDLGRNRRKMAEAIATHIPTLIIAGDWDNGSDGTVPICCTKFHHAQFVCLPNLAHAVMKNHPAVAEAIRNFWANLDTFAACLKTSEPNITGLSDRLIARLQSVSGMTDAHCRNVSKATVWATFLDGMTIRIWKNSMGVVHVFVVDENNECLYSGFVGWLHATELRKTLEELSVLDL